MVLKIRLARVAGPGGSKRHAPFYNIVLAQARSARDSKPMEVLGTYDPIPKLPVHAEPGARKQKDIQVDVSRAKYWLGVGAQPSDTVHRLLAMIGLLPPRFLANGVQTEDPLKAVRFTTRKPAEGKLRDLLNDFNSREKEPQQESTGKRQAGTARRKTEKQAVFGGEIGGEATSTTSPQNPNAA